MDVTDVPYVLQPNAVNIGIGAERRLTLQHFNNNDTALAIIGPHNCDARISNSNDREWPSDLLFDVSYGCAALKQWGDPTFVTAMRGIINRGRGRGTGGGEDPHGTAARSERAARRAKAKDTAMTVDTQDDYADVVLALWTRNAKTHQRQAQAKKADRTRHEVQKWLDSPQNRV